jgi:predicted metal-dependent hydrolase
MLFSAADRTVPLSIIRRAGVRRMNLRIDARAGAVKLTLPRFAALGPAMRWVEEKRSWIEAQLNRLPPSTPIVPGVVVPIGDQQLSLDWSADYKRQPMIVDNRLQIGGPLEGLEPRLLRWLKREALVRLERETREVATRAGVSVTTVRVGDPAARWGSCSFSGAIRYSWRLILAPDFVLRATVAHEVAHRVHMDHSPAFHAVVAELLGENPKAARAWLRANGSALHSFGRSF